MEPIFEISLFHDFGAVTAGETALPVLPYHTPSDDTQWTSGLQPTTCGKSWPSKYYRPLVKISWRSPIKETTRSKKSAGNSALLRLLLQGTAAI